jgi:hypothetical protein
MHVEYKIDVHNMDGQKSYGDFVVCLMVYQSVHLSESYFAYTSESKSEIGLLLKRYFNVGYVNMSIPDTNNVI